MVGEAHPPEWVPKTSDWGHRSAVLRAGAGWSTEVACVDSENRPPDSSNEALAKPAHQHPRGLWGESDTA